MDMLPDHEPAKTPKGFEFVGIRHPKAGDYVVDYYGKPILLDKESAAYYVEHTEVFKKAKKS